MTLHGSSSGSVRTNALHWSMNNATTRTSAAEMVAAARERYGGDPVSPDTFIYFIQQGDAGPIKIGRSTDPLGRLVGLQGANPYPLRLVRVEILREDEERNLHHLFGEYRLMGEWFRVHPILAAIAGVEPDPDLKDAPMSYRRFGTGLPWAKQEWTNPGGPGRLQSQPWPKFQHKPRRPFAPLQPLPPEVLADDVLTFRPESDEDGWQISSHKGGRSAP